MAPKKELERFPVNKKKPQPAKKANKPAENTKRMLNLPLEILNAFENTKVRAPIFQDEVEASLNLAKEKFTYFSALGIQELAKKKAELLAGISKRNEEIEEDEDKIMDDSEKNTKKSTKVYHERETDFPTL